MRGTPSVQVAFPSCSSQVNLIPRQVMYPPPPWKTKEKRRIPCSHEMSCARYRLPTVCRCLLGKPPKPPALRHSTSRRHGAISWDDTPWGVQLWHWRKQPAQETNHIGICPGKDGKYQQIYLKLVMSFTFPWKRYVSDRDLCN